MTQSMRMLGDGSPRRGRAQGKAAASAGDKPTINVSAAMQGVPRAPLNAQQQAEALRRLQAQAEQRVKLGLQLFKAAEAHTQRQQAMIAQVRSEQDRIREQMQNDVARSLQAYDQWVGQMDENFTRAIQSLESKIDRLARDWEQAQTKIETMVKRAEALLDQSRYAADGVHDSTGASGDAGASAGASSRAASSSSKPSTTASPQPGPGASGSASPRASLHNLQQQIDAVSREDLRIYQSLLRQLQNEAAEDERKTDAPDDQAA